MAAMSKSRAHPKPRPQHRKTYIQEWLDYRNKTHEQLAEALGVTRPHVTKIINGKRAYTQPLLEAAAEYLETEPGSLLMRDPTKAQPMWSIWDQASEGERKDIERLAEVIIAKKTG